MNTIEETIELDDYNENGAVSATLIYDHNQVLTSGEDYWGGAANVHELVLSEYSDGVIFPIGQNGESLPEVTLDDGELLEYVIKYGSNLG